MEESPDYDSPWKDILEGFFPEFIAFWFPDADREIDWERGHQFLDKELGRISYDAEVGRRYVDKLVRVWRSGGEEEWVLIHVEIQTGREREFAERMYVYNNRIYDRYRRRVAGFAILADASESWRPDRFEYRLWNCRVLLEFPIVKLIDWRDRIEEIRQSGNVFGVVTAAHLRTLQTRGNIAGRFRWKVEIMQSLYDIGYDEQRIRRLFRFIDWVMMLPKEINEQFYATMETFEKRGNRPYITSWERIGLERGMAKGMEQGLERGMQQGIQKGMQQGIQKGMQHIRELVLDTLHIRFGNIAPGTEEGLANISSVEDLRELHRLALTVETAEEFATQLSRMNDRQEPEV